MGFSKEARASAAIARKIKNWLGHEAYLEYKRTHVVPPNLDEVIAKGKKATKGAEKAVKAPSRVTEETKKLVRKTPSAPGILPPAPDQKATPEQIDTAKKLPPLHQPEFMSALAERGGRANATQLLVTAEHQAREDMPDSKVLQHYKTGVFQERGLSQEAAVTYRNDWYRGKLIPLWAVPEGTPVAIYKDDESPDPDIVGKVEGVIFRPTTGLREFKTNYIRVRGNDGMIYEYPALLSGSSKSPHARHPSFAAVEPIRSGKSSIEELGWSFPNFYNGDKAGPSSTPEHLDPIIAGMYRNSNWARSKEQRKAKLEALHRPPEEQLKYTKLNLITAQKALERAKALSNPDPIQVDHYTKLVEKLKQRIKELKSTID